MKLTDLIKLFVFIVWLGAVGAVITIAVHFLIKFW